MATAVQSEAVALKQVNNKVSKKKTPFLIFSNINVRGRFEYRVTSVDIRILLFGGIIGPWIKGC